MINQPDFQSLFRRESRDPIIYEVRWDSNCRHDVAFLDGLLHDACFQQRDVKRNGESLLLSVSRARWELFEVLDELASLTSRVEIGGVRSCYWWTKDPWSPERLVSEELSIETITLAKVQTLEDENARLLLRVENQMSGWGLEVELDPDRAVILLRDAEE